MCVRLMSRFCARTRSIRDARHQLSELQQLHVVDLRHICSVDDDDDDDDDEGICRASHK